MPTYHGCVDYAFKSQGKLSKMETAWKEEAGQANPLEAAVIRFCGANGYDCQEDDGDGFWRIAFGAKMDGIQKRLVFHFVRSDGNNDWKGIPGIKSTVAVYASVTSTSIRQKRPGGFDTYSTKGKLYISKT